MMQKGTALSSEPGPTREGFDGITIFTVHLDAGTGEAGRDG